MDARILPFAPRCTQPKSGIAGLFFNWSPAQQARRIHMLVESGLTESAVAGLTRWHVDDIRLVLSPSAER